LALRRRVLERWRKHQLVRRLSHATSLDRAGGRGLLKAGPVREVALSPLGDLPVRIRPGTSDPYVLDDTFYGLYHLPPPEVRNPQLIVDLGANIGLTLAHFATLYPAARLLGVELDATNAELCRWNTRTFGPRCTVVVAAVWSKAGTAEYERLAGQEWGYRVSDNPHSDQAVRVEAITVDALLERLAPACPIDYLKIDIEGAESQVLGVGGEWAERTRCLKVEIHEPYTIEMCRDALEGLGFRTRLDTSHWSAVVGLRACA
jgi:FkbM family methyltransferase